MESADALKGKDYLDYLIDYLRGKKEQEDLIEENESTAKAKKGERKQICFHELPEEEA